ncbi:MAG: hypothetical protein JXM73_26370 [Anaerolineae bacterium]|nr:hypothetical protein [Anaerolineae bacterium]
MMFASRQLGKGKTALLLALLFALLLAVPVSADGPLIFDGAWEQDYLAFGDLCPGIEVWDHEVGTFRQWVYLDKEGNWTSSKIHFIGTDTYYNPENPGVVLSGNFSAMTGFDLWT